MFRFIVLCSLFVGLSLVSSCGGSGAFGRDSDIIVHLTRTDGSQVMTDYELYLTKDALTTLDTVDPEAYASTTNQPSWMANYAATRSATELRLSYRTQSGQTPYFVFVKVPNTGAQFETLKFQVDVDGAVGATRSFDLDINTVQRLTGVRIDRNSATY